LNIRKSADAQFSLRTYRKSQGENKRAAYQYAENITYNVEISDSLLTFDPYFTVIPHDRWKFQSVDVALYVPVGTVIIAEKSLCNDRILGRLMGWRHHNGCKWVMTEKNGIQKQ
jgi:hypothetical protein